MDFMSKLRIFPIALVTAVAILLASFPAFLTWTDVGAYRAAETETGASFVDYGYIASDPVSVAVDGGDIYILDESGMITRTDGAGNFEKSDVAKGSRCIAAKDGKTYASSRDDALAAFCGAHTGEIAPDGIYILSGESLVRVALPSDGGSFIAGASDGETVYAFESLNGRISLYSFTLGGVTSGGTINGRLVAGDVETGDELVTEITAATVHGEDVYYSTPYSLYALPSPTELTATGGIVSMSAADDGTIYYVTVTGALYSFDGTTPVRMFEAADEIDVSSRKDFVLIADKGNNRVAAVSHDVVLTADVPRPTGAVADYTGSIYVSHGNSVRVFTRSLEPTGVDISFGTSTDPIKNIAIDASNVSGLTLYALTESGIIYSYTDSGAAPAQTGITGVSAFEVSTEGDLYVMRDDGSVAVYYNDNLTASPSKLFGSGTFVDLAIDNAGNVFRATSDSVYKNGEAEAVAVASGITDISVSRTEMSGPRGNVAFGDLLIASDNECGLTVVSGSEAGTDMANDPNDSVYKEFMTGIDDALSDVPYDTDNVIDIRTATDVAEIYGFPVEMPETTGKVGRGEYVIVLGTYDGGRYVYVIAETSDGSRTGFVNADLLSRTKELTDVYGEDFCAPTVTTDIYKYPSVNEKVAIIGEATYGKSYDLLYFVDGYRDSAGGEWCRISFEKDGVEYEGYIPRSRVSVNGVTGGDYRQIVPDAVIKADTEFVDVYGDDRGEFVISTIADGTPVELLEDFSKSKEFTHIQYVSNVETGAVTQGYVRTEFIKMTEASWYQFIFIIVGVILVVAIIAVIIVIVKKRKKID